MREYDNNYIFNKLPITNRIGIWLNKIGSDSNVSVKDLMVSIIDNNENVICSKSVATPLFNEPILAEMTLLKWDVNYDREVTVDDVDMIRCHVSGIKRLSDLQQKLSDVNGDRIVDYVDLKYVVSQLYYKDLDEDEKCDEDDVFLIYDYLRGYPLTVDELRDCDLDGDEKVTVEDLYLLLYAYYLNVESNPYLTHDMFFGDLIGRIDLRIGDLSKNGVIDDPDLTMFKKLMNGEKVTYRCWFLADINKDLMLTEEDYRWFVSYYMNDIPYKYEIDETDKTMTITGVKDKNIQFAEIEDTYYVNAGLYTVTGIGDNAFTGCMNLDAVYLPESITTIGCKTSETSPFYGTDEECVKVYCEVASVPSGFSQYWSSYADQVVLDYEMKNIEDYFYYEADEENKTLTILGGKGTLYYEHGTGYMEIDNQYLLNDEKYQVTVIGKEAFRDNNEIVDVVLPACLVEIQELAFSEMNNLCCVELWACHKLKKMGANVFCDSENIDTIMFFPLSLEEVNCYEVEDSLFWGVPEVTIIVRDGNKMENGGSYWNYYTRYKYIEPIVLYP